MDVVKRLELIKKWGRNGLAWLEVLKIDSKHKEAIMEVEVSAAACAELDPKHRQKVTQILQDYVWEQGYLSGEVTYEEYEQSGYFKEKYEKVA